MENYKNYRKKHLQPMRPWKKGEALPSVSISDADLMNGSPKEGDMIAMNPKDQNDKWLVAKKFFNDNYEEDGQKH